MSLLLHPFFYENDRTWFARHRLAPGSGIAVLLIGIIINRHILRVFANNHSQINTQAALDITAVMSTFVSFSSGVLQADMLRERETK